MHLDANLLVNLANKYGTPLYVYNGNMIVKRYQELYQHINYPYLKIFYAMKANYNPEILRLLENIGARIDAVSPGDVILAMKCGFSADRILYTANNITTDEMRQVAETGVAFNIGSLSELERYGKVFPGNQVCLRINPAIVAGAHVNIQTGGDLTKFGILMNDIEAAVKIADQNSLKIVGLHKHTGSGINEEEKFIAAVHNLLSVAKPGLFSDLKFIDFGGGLAVPYHPEEKRIDYVAFGKKITEIFTNFCSKFGRPLELYFEPGKFLVAEAGYLLVEVNTLKNNNSNSTF